MIIDDTDEKWFNDDAWPIPRQIRVLNDLYSAAREASGDVLELKQVFEECEDAYPYMTGDRKDALKKLGRMLAYKIGG